MVRRALAAARRPPARTPALSAACPRRLNAPRGSLRRIGRAPSTRAARRLDSPLAGGVSSSPVVAIRVRRPSAAMWSTIEAQVRRGERLTRDQGVYLLSQAP